MTRDSFYYMGEQDWQGWPADDQHDAEGYFKWDEERRWVQEQVEKDRRELSDASLGDEFWEQLLKERMAQLNRDEEEEYWSRLRGEEMDDFFLG